MKSVWTQKWKTALLWLCGYLNFLAYVLVGGWVIVKSENQSLKRTAKQVLVVTLIFTAIGAFLSLFSTIGAFFDNWYSSTAYEAYNWINRFVTIAKIVVYAVMIVLALVRGDDAADDAEKNDAPAQKNAVSAQPAQQESAPRSDAQVTQDDSPKAD